MTEDLHNNIDDLFRSGLEGKEDTPSPDVWAAIAKGLPGAPPASPNVPAPPAPVGGWSKTIIFKGFVGTVFLAMLGAAMYFFQAGRNETTAPKPDVLDTEIKQNQPAESSPVNVQTTPQAGQQVEKSAKDAQWLPTRATVRPTPSTAASQVNGAPEAKASSDQPQEPGSTALTSAGSQKLLSVRPAAERAESTSIISFPSGSAKVSTKTTSQSGSEGNAPGKVQPLAGQKAGPTPESAASKRERHSDPSVRHSPEKVNLAEINDRTGSTRITQAGSLLAAPRLISIPQVITGSNKNEAKNAPGNKSNGAATLRRKSWTSRIYLAPVYALNMTKMDVQENREYGPRLGREHIEFKETEEAKTTLSPGLIAGFELTPRISVQTGVSELRNDIQVSPKEIKAVRDRDGKVRYRLDCSSGSYFIDPKAGTTPAVGDSLRISSSYIRMKYISLPASVRVNFGNDKVRLFAIAGGDLNILTGKRTNTSLSPGAGEKVSPVRSEGTRKQYVTGTLGAGVEIKAGKRLGIMLMPQYRFPLGNMNEEGPVLTYPKTFSVSSGLRIDF